MAAISTELNLITNGKEIIILLTQKKGKKGKFKPQFDGENIKS